MGKKSGPLAFLNKKGWHPGNIRNQEKVWKKEQEALAEQKQVEELRKQYDEARQREEVEAMAVAAGVKKKQERLDWMYQGGMVAKQEAEKRADAQMLGEKEVELKAVEEDSKAEQLTQLPTFYTTDTPASANEMWQRLHGDPMFAIKQKELMARKKIVANPVQMDAIKRSIAEKAKAKAARKAAKAEAKAARRAAKKSKKDKKRKKDKKQSSSESSSSSDEEDRSAKRARTEQPVIRDSTERANGHAEFNNGRHFGDSRSQHHPSDREMDGRRDSERRLAPTRPAKYSERQRDTDRHRRREPDGRRGSAAEVERRDGGSHRHERERPPESVRVHYDGASAQGKDQKYGINHTAEDREDREAKKRETERRLDAAARKKEAEVRELANQRYQRKEYKTGKLTEEEKANRLAEMSGNAAVHEEARWSRLQAARKRDDSEEALEAVAREKAAAANAAPGRHHKETAKFLEQATKSVYGEGASLSDRIGRRKYTNDRSRDEGIGAFQRT